MQGTMHLPPLDGKLYNRLIIRMDCDVLIQFIRKMHLHFKDEHALTFITIRKTKSIEFAPTSIFTIAHFN